MAAESLIGLGLVVLSVSTLASLLLGGALALASAWLKSLGPWAERSAAALVLVLAPLFGLGVAIVVAASNIAEFAAGADHCLGHSHHLHLCPIHGFHWASVPWAVTATALFGLYVLARIGRTAWAHAQAQRSAGALARLGRPVTGYPGTFEVDSPERFAFTTGVLRPHVIVSSTAWNALGEEQRAALMAHEHAHIAHGDLWKRAVLGLLACFSAPGVSGWLLKRWEVAAERASDLEAVRRVGRPSTVASAILSLARSSASRHAPATAVFASACQVTDRVHSLFHQGQDGKPAARKIITSLAIASAVLIVAGVLFAESLHHVLETILG